YYVINGQMKSLSRYCITVLQSLGMDQPFYVLEPYGFEGLALPPAFEEIAADHVKSVRIVQPEGPYLLGGWCNGALMAYEIARQLHAQGQRVDLLVLMNSMALVYPVRYRVLPALLKLLGKLLRLGEDKQIDWYTRLRRANIYRIH